MDQIEQFLAVKRYAQNTKNNYRWNLIHFFETIGEDIASIGPVNLIRWLEGHHDWSEATRYIAYCAVRAYLKWRYGPGHPALEARIKKPSPRPQPSLNLAQVDKLIQIFETTPKGIRDLAMVSIFLDTGIRAAEITGLKLEHVHIDIEHPYLEFRAKGARWHRAGVSVPTAYDLDRWLQIRPGHARPGVATAFVSIGGETPGQRLTTDGMRAVVRAWGEAIGVKNLSPHDLRRTSSQIAAQLGAGDQLMMAQYGWTDPAMPRRYTGSLDYWRFIENYSPVNVLRMLR